MAKYMKIFFQHIAHIQFISFNVTLRLSGSSERPAYPGFMVMKTAQVGSRLTWMREEDSCNGQCSPSTRITINMFPVYKINMTGNTQAADNYFRNTYEQVSVSLAVDATE